MNINRLKASFAAIRMANAAGRTAPTLLLGAQRMMKRKKRSKRDSEALAITSDKGTSIKSHFHSLVGPDPGLTISAAV